MRLLQIKRLSFFTIILLFIVCCSTEDSRVERGRKILFLGNSITHTLPDSINGYWKGDWGLCASRRDSDYVHRIRKELKSINKENEVYFKNIAHWEVDFNVNKDSLFGNLCHDKDVIVINLGENVADIDHLGMSFDDLLSYCKMYTDDIIVVGCYWPDTKRDSIMRKVAENHQQLFVPISHIYSDHHNEVMFKVGDYLYDVNDNSYVITHEAQAMLTHPNDYAMSQIGKEIWEKLKVMLMNKR